MNKKIYVYLQPPCGLCNRLYSLESALRLQSLIPHSHLEVHWPLSDMFSTEPQEILNLPNVHFKVYERNLPLSLVNPTTADIFYSEKPQLQPHVTPLFPCYTNKEFTKLINPSGGNIHLITETGFFIKFHTLFNFLQINHFNKSIVKEALKIAEQHNLSSRHGVHFRGGDFYDLHPEDTNTSRFIQKIKEIKTTTPFFLSTDEELFIKELKKEGLDFISQGEIDRDRSSSSNGVNALIDLLALSHCKHIHASSNNSTFSLYSTQLQSQIKS